MQPRHAEPNANAFLSDLLRPMLGRNTALAQNSRTIVNHPAWQPDLLIAAEGRSPVVIEAEYPPAADVEAEARERLGCAVTIHPLPIEATIALRYPEEVRTAPDLRAALNEARFSYCAFTVARYGPPPERRIKSVARFPESGWLHGSLADLAELIRLVSVPQRAVDAAADALEKGIGLAANILDEMEVLKPAVNPKIADLLGMENVPQTRRMAGAIIANAMVFHHRIAEIHPGLRSLRQVCGPGIRIPQEQTLETWGQILKINYWPIFAIGRELLQEIPAYQATRILQDLYYIVSEVNGVDIDHARDLTGRVFQRLIADRKYLATFYTRPESAALLARLAVAQLDGIDWADAAAIGQLRIADFACGTGALLSAVYEQLTARHERAGGDPAALHPIMMEEVLYGCDVLPSAVHITSATLSGAQPRVGFGQSRLYTMPYGRLGDASVAIGSLEFLNSNTQMTLSNFSDPVLRTNGNGDERAHQATAELPESGFDLIIMNPPFTRAGSDWEGSGREGDAVKQFRGLNTDPAAQKEMADREKRFTRETCAHGYAGIASSFAALGNMKLKPGGVLALVLPLSAAAGISWQMFRQMLAAEYTELTVLSIATADNDQISFSADTAMGECLVVARKLRAGETGSQRMHFVSLARRLRDLAQSSEVSRSIRNTDTSRQLEDGPYDGVNLEVGTDLAGKMLTAECPADGAGWNGVRIADYSLAQTAYALADSRLWLPGSPQALELPTAPLNEVGQRGVYHRNIVGARTAPFTRTRPSRTATYPSLWNHDAAKETRMICQADSQLQVRRGREPRAAEVWATASRAHLNLSFRFSSQPLTAAFTERESIGGSAWPNVQFGDDRFDYPFVLWSNSTLGLLSFWWRANRQQAGRGVTTISAVETLPLLDLRALTAAQLTKSQEIFAEFRDRELLPAYLSDADPNRALLDRRVICDLLGFDETVYVGVRRLAEKWCAEPSVHGGKARPEGSRLAV